jgi:hypothetical protein
MTHTKQFGFNILIILFLISCNTLKWLPENERGKATKPFMTVYCNDYLRFHFDTHGSANILSKSNYLKFMPKQVINDVKKELKKYPNSKIIYAHSDTGLSPNKFYSIGLLTKKVALNPTHEPIISYFGSKFYEDTAITLNDSFYKIKHTIPIKDWDIKVLDYDIKSNKPDEYNFFYKFEFFKAVFHAVLQKSLSIDDNYTCASLESIQSIYWDSINVEKGKYLTQLAEILKRENDYKKTTDRYLLYEFLCNQFSFINQLDSVKYYLAKQDSGSAYAKRGGKKIPNTLIQKNSWNNAAASVLAAAKNTKILMFNESHFDWRHRYFVTTMLDSLYNIGYRYLAAEALTQYDDSLMIRKFPIQTTGYYLSEPYMANLIRQAIKKGFKLVAYEDTLQDNKREYNQALNIYNKIKHDTAARIIVYAGYGHINKDTANGKSPAMAGYLRKMVKRDIFTIEQTRFADIFYDDTFFKDRPKGYYSSNLSSDSNKSADLYVLNNLDKQPYANISTTGANKNYELKLPDSLFSKNITFASILVYINNEYEKYKEKAIPVYIQLINKQSNILFNLPVGNYIVIVEDSFGNSIFKSVPISLQN